MKNHLAIITTSVLALALLSACADNYTDIAIAEIPADIMTKVQTTLPGITLSEAKKKLENGIIIYELEGTLVSGKKYEIEITGSGDIIEIELEE